MERVPAYVSIVFILTTFITAGFLVYSIRRRDTERAASRILFFALPFWMIFSAVLSLGGFYQNNEASPPRVFAFGVFPALVFIGVYFGAFRASFIELLSLKALTLLHTIRVPVELVLLWLFHAGAVPQIMTFEGRNFDILSGLTAPLAYFLAFRSNRTDRRVLVIWNVFALVLLFNIVITAALSLPSPMQRFALEQPNVAVMYFPYIWLPAVVVPIVLFSHLASLWQLFKGNSGERLDIKTKAK